MILLVHGIRTQAEWGARIGQLLEDRPETVVMPVRYGFFDSFRFLLPFKGVKTRKVKIVEQAIRDIQRRYPDAKLSILAHSFGCYLVGRILEEEPDIKLHRLVLCGSVLRRDFPWVALADDRIGAVVNECGWRDIWPVLADSVTWGYGSSGRFGFEGGTRVEERFHDLAHSDFLTTEFAAKHWLPFFRDGTVVPGAGAERPTTSLWVSLLGVIRVRYVATLVLIAGLLLGVAGLYSPTPPGPDDDVEREGVVLVPATDRHEEFFPNSPGLEWSLSSVDAEDSITGYEVRFASSPEFVDPVLFETGTRPFIALTRVRQLIRDREWRTGRIFWSVRAGLEAEGFTAWSEPHSFDVYRNVLDRIAQRREVRIGVSRSQEDLFSCKGRNGEWLGIDMDLVRRLIPYLEEHLDVRISPDFAVETYDWSNQGGDDEVSSIWEAAVRRRVDMVVSSVTGKPEREEKYNIRFSRPYFFARQTVVRAPGQPRLSLAELRGRKIGAQGGTTNWEYARHLETTVEPYFGNDTMGQLIRDLVDGKLDAFFLDEPYAHMRNRTRADLGSPPLEVFPLQPEQLAAASFPRPHSEDYAIVLHSGEKELREVLNAGLDDLEQRGFLKLLQDKARLDSPCLGT